VNLHPQQRQKEPQMARISPMNSGFPNLLFCAIREIYGGNGQP
jgi:hypothetical protein